MSEAPLEVKRRVRIPPSWSYSFFFLYRFQFLFFAVLASFFSFLSLHNNGVLNILLTHTHTHTHTMAKGALIEI